MNRRICAFAAVIYFAICMALGCFETCFAAGGTKEYSIKSADFDIRLNEDGSARVTEKWNVKYETGSFTRFYKDIYKISAGNEAFEKADDFSVKIDGKECKKGTASKRDDYTYAVENNSDTITISCFKNSNKVERTYEISYVLKNVVKTDGKDWYFIYRVIGKNFEKTVPNISVSIYAPEGKQCTEECIYKTYGQVLHPSDGCIKIECGSNTGMFKVGAKISGENVFSLSYGNVIYNKNEKSDNDTYANKKTTKKTEETEETEGYAILLGIILLTCLIIEIKDRFKKISKTKNNVELTRWINSKNDSEILKEEMEFAQTDNTAQKLNKIISKWVTDDDSALEFAILFYYVMFDNFLMMRTDKVMAALMYEMQRKGYILSRNGDICFKQLSYNSSNDILYVDKNDEMTMYEKAVIDILNILKYDDVNTDTDSIKIAGKYNMILMNRYKDYLKDLERWLKVKAVMFDTTKKYIGEFAALRGLSETALKSDIQKAAEIYARVFNVMNSDIRYELESGGKYPLAIKAMDYIIFFGADETKVNQNAIEEEINNSYLKDIINRQAHIEMVEKILQDETDKAAKDE